MTAGTEFDEVTLIDSLLRADGQGTLDRLQTASEPATSTGGVILTPASAIQFARPRWAWEDRIPRDAVSLLVGDPGLGKSAITTELAARWSRGQAEGDLKGQPVDVVIATAEDSWETTVKPRLVAAGADLERVHRIEIHRDRELGDILLPDDLSVVETGMRKIEARVLTVDPLVAFLPATVNSWRDQDVRRVLAPLRRLAESLGATVVAIMHLNKRETTELLTRIGGSVGMPAAARSVLVAAPDPDDPEGPTRILAHAKCNLGPKSPALRYRIEGREVEGDGELIPTAGVAWLGDADGIREADLLGRDDGEERSAVAECGDWLVDFLAEGPQPPTECIRAGRGEGFSRATIKRAKKRRGIRSSKPDFDAGWVWILPPGGAAGAHEGAQYGGVEPLGASAGQMSLVDAEGAHVPDIEPLGAEDARLVEPPPAEQEALALLISELDGTTDPFEVIRRRRKAGEPDEAIAGYLNTGGWPVPPGAVRWTGYGVRSVLGEGGGLA